MNFMEFWARPKKWKQLIVMKYSGNTRWNSVYGWRDWLWVRWLYDVEQNVIMCRDIERKNKTLAGGDEKSKKIIQRVCTTINRFDWSGSNDNYILCDKGYTIRFQFLFICTLSSTHFIFDSVYTVHCSLYATCSRKCSKYENFTRTKRLPFTTEYQIEFCLLQNWVYLQFGFDHWLVSQLYSTRKGRRTDFLCW